MPNKFKLIFLILFIIFFQNNDSFSQSRKGKKEQYFSLQSGIMGDNFNSTGVRLKLEYFREIKDNFQFGISSDNKMYLYEQLKVDSATASKYPSLHDNTNMLNANLYYRFSILHDRINWQFGFGYGVAYLYWKGDKIVCPVMNINATINLRITKRIYFETAPLIILFPYSIYYYSSINYKNYTHYSCSNMFPVGLKIKF